MHASGQMISQLRFAEFLMENFGESLMQQRRERERHLAEMMRIREAEEKAARSQARNDITASLLIDEEDEEERISKPHPAPAPVALPTPPHRERVIEGRRAEGSGGRIGLWIAGIAAVAAAAAVALWLLGVY
jgi:hypothetical protein